MPAPDAADRRLRLASGHVLTALFVAGVVLLAGSWFSFQERPYLADVGFTVALLLIGTGASRGIVLLLRHVAGRKRAESELLVLHAALQDAVEGIRCIDRDGLCLRANATLAHSLGYEVSELVGRTWLEIVHPGDHAALTGAHERMAQSGNAKIEVHGLAKDGSTRELEMLLVRALDSHGRFAGHHELTRDISLRKAEAAEQRRNERRLAEAQQMARLGSWEWNVERDHITWSPEALSIFQVEPARLGCAFGEFLDCLHADDRAHVRSVIKLALAESSSFAFDCRMDLAGGDPCVIHGAGGVVLDEAGAVTGIVGTVQDVTGRVEKERERARQHQLELQEKFMSHVSHELRSPVAAIHQFVTILLDRLAGDLTPEQEEYLEIMFRNVNQLRSMISDLLEVTRAQTGKLSVAPRRIDLRPVIQDALQSVSATAAGRHVELAVEVWSDAPELIADPCRLRQVLTNLLENAIKFTGTGGRVTLAAGPDPDGWEKARLTVRDTGTGIGPEHVQRIFEHLYQVDQSADQTRKGLGLGLYICKQLVELQGGRIWVESEPGAGSSFHFTVPAFALEPMLRAGLRPQDLAAGALALVTVNVVRSDEGPLEDGDEKALAAAWSILRHSHFLDRDTLLPRVGRAQLGERFLLVAATDAHGAGVLAGRIARQLGACPELKSAGLLATVDWEPIAVSGDDDTRLNAIVDRIAGVLGEPANEISMGRVA
jgi:PAS domain S-box-containing protein